MNSKPSRTGGGSSIRIDVLKPSSNTAPSSPAPNLLKWNTTPLRTRLHNRSERACKRRPEPLNLRRRQEIRVPSTSLDNLIGLCRKESTRGLRTARVRSVEAGNEDGGFALIVELPVDKALGEEHAGEVAERGVDHGEGADDWGWLANDVPGAVVILEDEGADETALDDGQEFVGARVPVGGVEAAWIDEADGLSEPSGTESGEVVDGGEDDAAAGGRCDGVVDELERIVLRTIFGGRMGEDDGLAGGFGLRKKECVALRCELLGSEHIHGAHFGRAVALSERIQSLETLVVLGRASFQRTGLESHWSGH